MQQYLDLLENLVNRPDWRNSRSMPTVGMFGHTMRFNLIDGFPLLTTKRVHWWSVVHELLWMISGSTNVAELHKKRVTIWDEWANEHGELGPVYGKQWRQWSAPDGRKIDQLANLIQGLRDNPFSRRHILNSWNPADLGKMALPPCHILFQCYVDADGKGLRTQMYQRSADVFLGVPFNIAGYALLTHMISQVCGFQAREFVWVGGDIHLYQNQIEAAKLQLQRSPKLLPTLHLDSTIDNIDAFTYEHVHLYDYDPHPTIAVSVVR